jgi:NlpC/P60 family putative phage cell wall peptidase
MPTRSEIVATARTYVGTPFQHQGRIKGVGTDCVGIPMMVAEELGMNDKHGQPITTRLHNGYSKQPWGNLVLQTCALYLIAKPITQMKPGDVIVLRVPKDPCHVAVVSLIPGQGLGMIHAYQGSEKTVENRIDERWHSRIAGCFEFPGVIDG